MGKKQRPISCSLTFTVECKLWFSEDLSLRLTRYQGAPGLHTDGREEGRTTYPESSILRNQMVEKGQREAKPLKGKGERIGGSQVVKKGTSFLQHWEEDQPLSSWELPTIWASPSQIFINICTKHRGLQVWEGFSQKILSKGALLLVSTNVIPLSLRQRPFQSWVQPSMG